MHRNAAAQQSQAVHRWCCILKEKVTACLLGLAQCQPWAIQLTLAEVVPVVPTTKTHMVETNACFLRGISKKPRNTCMASLLGKTKVLLRVSYSKKHSYDACCGTDIHGYTLLIFRPTFFLHFKEKWIGLYKGAAALHPSLPVMEKLPSSSVTWWWCWAVAKSSGRSPHEFETVTSEPACSKHRTKAWSPKNAATLSGVMPFQNSSLQKASPWLNKTGGPIYSSCKLHRTANKAKGTHWSHVCIEIDWPYWQSRARLFPLMTPSRRWRGNAKGCPQILPGSRRISLPTIQQLFPRSQEPWQLKVERFAADPAAYIWKSPLAAARVLTCSGDLDFTQETTLMPLGSHGQLLASTKYPGSEDSDRFLLQ